MFYLIGLGLNPKQITQEALEALKGCDEICLDTYTSAYAEGSISEVEKAVGKKFAKLGRGGVEQEFAQKLREAKGRNIALAVFGDALAATTHVQLLLDAKKGGIEFRVLHGISVFDVVAECGLDRYKFGRACTIVKPQKNYAPESFYGVIENNKKAGLHTLCLLDIGDAGSMMGIGEALEILERIEKNRNKNAVKNSMLVGIAGAGSRGREFAHGSAEKLKKIKFRGLPQSLVVCGELNDKEQEALEALA